jgi:hypothetical protein
MINSVIQKDVSESVNYHRRSVTSDLFFDSLNASLRVVILFFT